MYTPITPEYTRTVVADRVRDAKAARLARRFRRTTSAG